MPSRGYKKPESKEITLRFRVTELEAEKLRLAAKRAGYSLSEFIRQIMLRESEKIITKI